MKVNCRGPVHEVKEYKKEGQEGGKRNLKVKAGRGTNDGF